MRWLSLTPLKAPTRDSDSDSASCSTTSESENEDGKDVIEAGKKKDGMDVD